MLSRADGRACQTKSARYKKKASRRSSSAVKAQRSRVARSFHARSMRQSLSFKDATIFPRQTPKLSDYGVAETEPSLENTHGACASVAAVPAHTWPAAWKPAMQSCFGALMITGFATGILFTPNYTTLSAKSSRPVKSRDEQSTQYGVVWWCGGACFSVPHLYAPASAIRQKNSTEQLVKIYRTTSCT